MAKIVICKSCNKEREHYAKGLCLSCYERGRTAPIIICIECGEEKEHCAKGLCGPCYKRQWYEEHRKERIQAQKEWRVRNREYHKDYNRRYRREHLEEKRLYNYQYSREHREEALERTKRWQKENPERAKARSNRWKRENPERVRIHGNRRRARKVNAEGCASAEQIAARVEYYGGLCYLCGRPYEAIDHVVPLSRGGSNWPANQRPICALCNARKGAKMLGNFLVQLPLMEGI